MKHLFMAAFLLCGISIAAQTPVERQVVSSQGASERTERIRLDWTLGEPAVATLATSSGYLTEGFQQPALRVEALALPAAPATPFYDIRVAPNPTSSQLTVQLPAELQEELIWELHDMYGKSLQRQMLPIATGQDIDVGAYPCGIYLLRFSTRQGRLLQTFRIVKVN